MAGSPDVLSGTFAGRYTIERELGSGATATVYLARDTQRGINVAVKLLRPELAQSVGAERFLREIRLNEKLHHPHIVPVLDSGEYDGRLYFVLPLMEDGSLRQLLMREKQLPIEQAIAITKTIAEALHYAHQQNLIHRDVKPENILFTSGQACLADFGIAKAVERALDQSTTESGMVRGTPAYMSPEQASGSRQYDGRSDQYSLACVLYEMLAGVPAFIGPTPEAVIAQRFQHPPRELRVYRPSVPPSIETAITKALAISPADRFATLAEFAAALQTTQSSPGIESRVSGPSVALTRPRVFAFTGAVLAFAAVAALIGNGLGRLDDRPPAVVNFVLPPPTGAQFADNLRDVSAVSPDGREIVFAGTDSAGVRHLWLRRLADRRATKIPGTENGSRPFWSPDGSSIGFFHRFNRSLVVMDRPGGVARTLATTTLEPRGGSWSSAGVILFAPGTQTGIYMQSLTESTARPLTTPSVSRGEIGHLWPHVLPGGRDFLYLVASDVDSVRGIYIASIADPKRARRIVSSSASAAYSAGHLLYVHDGALVAQRLDLGSRTLSGDRRLIADSVAVSVSYNGAFSASNNGVLVYAGGRSRDVTRLTWMDSTGTVKGFASTAGYLRNPDLSADGARLAYETYKESNSDIRTVDLATGASTLLPQTSAQAVDPVWSPDGTRLAFVAERPGAWAFFRKTVDVQGTPELLFTSPRPAVLMDWSRDETLVIAERTAGGDWDLVGRRLPRIDVPIPIAGGAGHQVDARVSSDGKYIAYVSTESGRGEVYVQRFPVAEARCQVSVGGGHQPVWGRGDGSLFFLGTNGSMMHATVDFTRRPPCARGAPRTLFDTGIRSPSTARSFFEVSPKNGLFLVNAPSDTVWLNVIVNWLAAPPATP